MLWSFFTVFFLIGCVSFGGGYAIIPLIQIQVLAHDWMTTKAFTDTIAMAGMAPGSIATNSATLVGYQKAGIPGALVSAAGMILPSLLLVLLLANLLDRLHQKRWVKAAFYGLRPIVTGLIIFASIQFAWSNQIIGAFTAHSFSLLAIFVLAFYALLRFRLSPVYVLILSGIAGMLLY